MAVEKVRTSLSAGIVVRRVLLEDTGVAAITDRVFSVSVNKVKLPYIYYRRSGMEINPVKVGRAADTIEMELICCSASYDEGLELAEAARAALCGAQCTVDNMTMRSCTLTNSEEGWQDDAFIQILNFLIKIA